MCRDNWAKKRQPRFDVPNSSFLCVVLIHPVVANRLPTFKQVINAKTDSSWVEFYSDVSGIFYFAPE
jgi:hypothetical protein